MIDKDLFRRDILSVRERVPLVLNLTNFVAMTPSANALLAIGASPVISSCVEEMPELVRESDAVVINIGCLDRFQVEAMRLAASVASAADIPWVLDPVGAGATRLRTDVSLELARSFYPAVIRGNASEIMALAGDGTGTRGVDSRHNSVDAVMAARSLANQMKTVVSVSGEVDYITDGERIEMVSNGNPLMSRVTAMGCIATALTAAVTAVDRDYMTAATNAMALMGTVGEVASEGCRGTGSFFVNFMDCLSSATPSQLSGMIINR